MHQNRCIETKDSLYLEIQFLIGLTLHPEKTRLIDLETEKGKPGQENKTFDFLGFTHYMGMSRKGKRILKRKTSSKKLNASLKRMSEWIKANRHKLSMPFGSTSPANSRICI